MDLNLQGKKVLVTGASKGIGLSVAKAFLAEGALVAINSSNRQNLDSACLELGVTCLALCGNLGVTEDVCAIFDAIEKRWGALDILVNNAAIMIRAPLMETTLDQWDIIFNVNLRGAFLCCQRAVPLMEKVGGGAIVNTSSNAADMPMYGAGVYATTKGGMNTLTKALAGELAPRGIRVNAYLPGLIPTEQNQPSRNSLDKEALLAPIALHRYGTVEEMANVVLFLASSRSSFITGELLVVNGGKYTIQNPWKGWEMQ